MSKLSVSVDHTIPTPALVSFKYQGKEDSKPVRRIVLVYEDRRDYLMAVDLARDGEYRKFLRERIVDETSDKLCIDIIGYLVDPTQFVPSKKG